MKAATPAGAAADATLAAPASEDDETRKAELIAELEKRKARAQRWGMPVDEIDAKLKRIERFGLEETSEGSMKQLDDGLLGGKKAHREAKAGGAGKAPAANGSKAALKESETVREQGRCQVRGQMRVHISLTFMLVSLPVLRLAGGAKGRPYRTARSRGGCAQKESRAIWRGRPGCPSCACRPSRGRAEAKEGRAFWRSPRIPGMCRGGKQH